MNIKTIAIWAILIIIVLTGVYFIFFSGNLAKQQAKQDAAAVASTDASTKVEAQDVTVGTGALAEPGMQVSVLYVGKLSDGTVFDSSEAHGNVPLKFTLGAQGLIPGFQIGVNGMKEGGERLMAIPASLGYGAQDIKDEKGTVIIPANSTIIFDVKLVKVEAAPAAPAEEKPATKTNK